MMLFRFGTLLLLIQILFTFQAMGSGVPRILLSEPEESISMQVIAENGLVTSLPAVNADGHLEQISEMHSKLLLQKEELTQIAQDRKFSFKDGLITVVMPGGLLYAAAVQERQHQAEAALDNVTIRLAELSQEISGLENRKRTRPAERTSNPAPQLERSTATPLYSYKVLNVYPHDQQAFTQGLVFKDGLVYEGTGRYGQSTLRKVDLETGRINMIAKLPKQYFGEGVAVCGDKLIQLTWKSKMGLIFDKKEFELLQVISFPMEGWGVTCDEGRLFVSDGSERLYILDADSFQGLSSIKVHDQGKPINGLNELEYIAGEIYANVWKTDRIARISPETGEVLGWIDLTGLLSVDEKSGAGVLNGIAYDPTGPRMFVTGKLWPKLFQIELVAAKP